jgi:hypothetical protein
MTYGADPRELARRVRREIMRREQAAAFALSGTRQLWNEVLADLSQITCNPDISPIRIVQQLHTYFRKFEDIAVGDRAYLVLQAGKGKRNFDGWLMTVAADTHPLVAGESCLLVRATTFHMGRKMGYAHDSFLAALSSHALTRIQERSNFTIDNVIDSLLLSGLLAMHLSTKMKDGLDREILIRFEDTVLAGAIRFVGDADARMANHMIDFRTALDASSMLNEEQLARANAAGALAFDLFEGRPNDTVLELPLARADYINLNARRITKEERDAEVLLPTGGRDPAERQQRRV